MSAITINTFPSLNSFTSPRSWFLAIIVLLHIGFFWALSSGLSQQVYEKVRKFVVVPVPEERPRVLPKPTPLVDGPVTHSPVEPTIPMPRLPEVPEADVIKAVVEPPPHPPVSQEQPRTPVVVEPKIDARIGLSEPVYPAAAIRMNQIGTVMLSVLVLENGRIGEVRVERSSGYPKLDEAAVREARRWRLVPGTRDGAPTAMWKQIPITFRLQNQN